MVYKSSGISGMENGARGSSDEAAYICFAIAMDAYNLAVLEPLLDAEPLVGVERARRDYSERAMMARIGPTKREWREYQRDVINGRKSDSPRAVSERRQREITQVAEPPTLEDYWSNISSDGREDADETLEHFRDAYGEEVWNRCLQWYIKDILSGGTQRERVGEAVSRIFSRSYSTVGARAGSDQIETPMNKSLEIREYWAQLELAREVYDRASTLSSRSMNGAIYRACMSRHTQKYSDDGVRPEDRQARQSEANRVIKLARKAGLDKFAAKLSGIPEEDAVFVEEVLEESTGRAAASGGDEESGRVEG